MIVHHSWEAMRREEAHIPRVVIIGAFDGIHLGHQHLIRAALDRAAALDGEAWLLTFDPHPARLLAPEQAPPLLTSITHKLRLLEPFGLTGVVVHPFTRALSQWAPEQFLEILCRQMTGLHTIVVGPNFHFGHRAHGHVDLLHAQASHHGYQVLVPEPVAYEGDIVSSTRIRQAVEERHLEVAKHMLGRSFSLWGTVTAGRQYGRELGFPTANIRLQEEARPPTGVYAVRALLDGTLHNGAAYLGIRPTAGGDHVGHLLEVHLLDVQMDLYGKEIEVYFLKHLRGDQRFPDPESLREQIGRDVRAVRNWLNETKEAL